MAQFPYDLNTGQPLTVQAILAGAANISAGQGVLVVSTLNPGSGTNAISANQQLSAQLLGGTAFIGDVSALSPDAGLFRVSTVGGTTGDHTLVDGTTQTISATLTPISAKPAGTVAGLVVNTFQADASQLLVSTKSPDAGLFRVSAIGGTAGDRTLVDGTTQTISATLTPISASPATTVAGLVTNTFQQDAGKFLASAKQGDAGNLHVCAVANFGSTAGVDAVGSPSQYETVGGAVLFQSVFPYALNSASNWDRVRSIAPSGVGLGVVQVGQWDASINQVSGKSGDAGLFRASAQAFDRTTSAFMTAVGNSLQLSTIGTGNVGAQLSGTWTGTIAFQGTVDEANFFPVWGIDNSTGALVSSTTISRNVQFNLAGFRRFQLSATAAMTGTLSAFLGSTATTVDPIAAIKQEDAGNARLSALQADAGLQHVSAINQDANFMHVSGFSPDAGLFRVSAGPPAASVALTDAEGNSPTIPTTIGNTAVFNVIYNYGANSAVAWDRLRTIAPSGVGLGVLQVGQWDASINQVSGKSNDAGLFHASAFVDSGSVSAKQSDAGNLHASAFVDSGSVSAKSPDANNLHVSAVEGDAGLLHASASIFPDTTGGLTMFSNFNVSTSQTVKSTAGAVYGWYAWNSDTKPVYVNLYNTSGAINVGVDTIQVQIMLPASAAANVFTPIGLKGFTNGIGIAAVSGAVSTSNSPPAGSAVGANIFYK